MEGIRKPSSDADDVSSSVDPAGEIPTASTPSLEQGSSSYPELIIEAGRTEKNYWADLWRYRELFAILAWRDVAVRYKQTVIGVAWAVVRPFLTMVIFTIVFGKVAKLPAPGDVPYALCDDTSLDTLIGNCIAT